MKTWQVSLTAAYGTFRTAHVASCPDVAPECSQVAIPDHRHRSRLDLSHLDLLVAYGARSNLVVSARIPWDLKDQTIGYTTLDGRPYAPPYGDIHHRTETLSGVSDADVLVGASAGKGWVFGAGFTVPLGDTEPDPIALGRQGKEHEHIQFGSGTVDPRLAVQWSRGFGRVRMAVAADGRFPLYENSRGFRAPVAVRWSLGPTLAFGSAGLSLLLAGQYQSIGRWSGEKDEGTGFHNGGAVLQTSLRLGAGWRLAPALYREIYSRSLSDETFRQDTTYSLVLSRFFR